MKTKKSTKFIVMLFALLAVIITGCSNGNSSDSEEKKSRTIDSAFKDCTNSVDTLELEDGNWTIKVITGVEGMEIDTTIELIANSGEYNFTSGLVITRFDLTLMMDKESLETFNSLSNEAKKDVFKDPESGWSDEDIDISFEGNTLIGTKSMNDNDLVEMKEGFSLKELGKVASIRTNVDNSKYVAIYDIEDDGIVYITKEIVSLPVEVK